MTVLLTLLCFAGQGEGSLQEVLLNRRYLDAARRLRPAAHAFESAQAVRRYSVLLVEYHASQLAYRGFYMKNLAAGERLRLLRGAESLIGGPDFAPVEDDLEGLLLEAEKRFPADPDIRFAKAVYVFNGTCCFIKPKIRLTQPQILGAFREGEARGVRSGSSMWALALNEMARDKPDRNRLGDLLHKAHSLQPDNPDIYGAFVDDLLVEKQFENALPHARNLFEISIKPAERADALVRVARVYIGMDRCDRAMEAVRGGLKILPQHGFLFLLGLECLRKASDQPAYNSYLSSYFAQEPDRPTPFRSYLEYLRERGVIAMDEVFMNRYATGKDDSVLAAVTRQFNLVTYAGLMQRPREYGNHLDQARNLLEQLEAVPEELARVLELLASRAPKLTP